MSEFGATHFWQCHVSSCEELNPRSKDGEKEKCRKCNEKRSKRHVIIVNETKSWVAWTCVFCNFDSKDKFQCRTCDNYHFSENFETQHSNSNNLLHDNHTSSTPDLSHPSVKNISTEKNGQGRLERSGSESQLRDLKAFCLELQHNTVQAVNHDKRDQRRHFARKPEKQILGDPVEWDSQPINNRGPFLGKEMEFDSKNGGARPKTPKKGICKCTFKHVKKDKCEVCAYKKQEKPTIQQQQEQPIHTFLAHKGREDSENLCLYLPKNQDKIGIQPDSQKSPTSELRMFFTVGWVCRICMTQVEISEVCEGCKGHKNDVEFKGLLNEFLNSSAKLSSSLKENLFKKHDEDAKRSFTVIKQFCEKNGCQFEDKDFSDHTWKRCTLISTDCDSQEEWQIYNEPEPSDIQQGKLNNCWLLSALTVISGRKDLLDKIILTKDVTYHGVYQIRLCKDGIWERVIVDDTFPCNDEGRLLYSKAKRKQLWVPLIEKAAAKLHGGYNTLETGSTLEALSLLTGHPCDYKLIGELGTSDPLEIWQFLLDAKKNTFLMSTSTPEKRCVGNTEAFRKTGLNIGHAYSVLDVQEVEKEKLINLRNPWGDHRCWKGDWCDTCGNWSRISERHRKKLLRYRNAQGIFWMCLNDFIRYFASIEVCKTRESGWYEVRLQGTFPRNTAEAWKFVQLTVDKNTDFHIGLHQKNLRGMQYNQGEPLLDLLVTVFKKSKDANSSVGKVVKTNTRDARSFVGYDVSLEKGTYIIASLAFKQWKSATAKRQGGSTSGSNDMLTNYALVIHSMREICYQEVNTNDEQYEHALADMVIRLAIDKGDEVKRVGDVSLYLFEGYGTFYVIENNSGKYAEVNLKLTTDYVKLTRTQTDNSVKDIVPSFHRQVLTISTPYEHLVNWNVEFEMFTVKCMNSREGREKHDPEIDPASEKLYIPRKIRK